jgi:putative tricarboxylic transport membrane protein
VLRELKRLGERRNVEGMARFGIVAKNVYGVSKPRLDELARKIGRNHSLGLALWETGNHDARILAGMIAERKLVTGKQMERWVRDFDNWDVCDGTCCHLFVFAMPAWQKAHSWGRRKKEFQKRAGFALAAVGTDPVTGALRLTFGTEKLLNGFDFLVAVIGLFGIGEILLTLEEGLAFKGASAKINMRVVLDTWKELPRYWMTSLRSAAVGVFMGIVPGGATPASFMSYGVARRFSPNGEKFGTGQLEGVVAPETAAHAAGTSALLPMLTLGVPGSPTAAVLLGGLLIWGLQPGPLLFVEQKDFVWGLIASMYLGNIAGLIVVMTCVPLFAAILRIPFSVIAPVIIAICAIGSYTVHNSIFDVWMMVVFGVAGYAFKKLNYPLAPLVLAIVLGDRAEASFRQAMLVSQGEMSVFFSNGLVGTMTGLALALLFWPLVSWALSRFRASV